MTEAEWLTGADPEPLERYLWQIRPTVEDRVSLRKLGLFCVACCRRIWPLLVSERDRFAVDYFERFLDGGPSVAEAESVVSIPEEQAEGVNEQYIRNPGHQTAARAVAADAVWFLLNEVEMSFSVRSVYTNAAAAVAESQMPPDKPHRRLDLFGDGSGVNRDVPAPPPAVVEMRAQAYLFREIFGNPFRPVSISRSWLAWNEGAICKLTQLIYDDRAFDRLPLLADALEEAGCDNRDILDHCRSGGEHVRGCWVVDLLLGKS